MTGHKKYKITRTTLRYEDGHKDILLRVIETDEIEKERVKLQQQFNCKYAEFRFSENVKV